MTVTRNFTAFTDGNILVIEVNCPECRAIIEHEVEFHELAENQFSGCTSCGTEVEFNLQISLRVTAKGNG